MNKYKYLQHKFCNFTSTSVIFNFDVTIISLSSLKSEESAQWFFQKSKKWLLKHSSNSLQVLKAICKKTKVFKNLTKFLCTFSQVSCYQFLLISHLKINSIKILCSLKKKWNQRRTLFSRLRLHSMINFERKGTIQQRSWDQSIGCSI